MTAQSNNLCTILSQFVGAEPTEVIVVKQTYNSGNPNSIVVNLNVLCGCKEKWNELEF
jgi:hypothetical protein